MLFAPEQWPVNEALSLAAVADDIAFIQYTSGRTGDPKGIVLSHANLLASLYFGNPLVVLSPLAFLARPERWLWAIHRHRGTLSAAPNFAYELCLKRSNHEQLEGLNLSSMRFMANRAEPVSAAAIERFAPRLGWRSARRYRRRRARRTRLPPRRVCATWRGPRSCAIAANRRVDVPTDTPPQAQP